MCLVTIGQSLFNTLLINDIIKSEKKQHLYS